VNRDVAAGRDAGAPPDWDALSYDRISDMQLAWGREVLDRLELSGDEVVLDAGCGTGRVTALLAERLTSGRVIGVDASPSMIERARETLGPEAELIVADVLKLDLPAPVDVVFSNATFHWISDHDALFDRLYALLRPGGRLEAQCGAEGNVAPLVEAFRLTSRESPFVEHLRGWTGPWLFAPAEETRGRLERTGFEAVRCWTEEKRVVLENPRDFHRTVGFAAHLERLPEALHDDFFETVLARVPDPSIQNFVRLNISARRPDG
jgi:trans-aconitate 2-methyltransferase